MERLLECLGTLRNTHTARPPLAFAEVAQPLHAAVTRVHLMHHRSFIAGQRALPHRNGADEWVSSAGVKLSEQQERESVREVCHAVIAQAQGFEEIRSKMRGEAGAILRSAAEPAQKRYLLSIIHYFLGEHFVAPSHDIMDVLAHELETRAGLRAVYPVHSRLIDQLSVAEDADAARSALQAAIAGINEGFTEVCAWYAELASI